MFKSRVLFCEIFLRIAIIGFFAIVHAYHVEYPIIKHLKHTLSLLFFHKILLVSGNVLNGKSMIMYLYYCYLA